MNYFAVFFQTFLLGIIVSAPMGPMGILVAQRTLSKGRPYGFISGLGVATADLFFSLIALFGLSALNIDIESVWFRIVGGAVLSFVGFFMLKAHPSSFRNKAPVSGKRYAKYYVSALLLTLTNPLSILFFAAYFAAMGFTPKVMTSISYGIVVGSVFLGALTWWVFITTLLGFLHKKISVKSLFFINKISGIIIIIFGVLSILSGLYGWNFKM